MKIYIMPNGRKYQFEDGKVPEGAVEVKAVEPQNKSVAPKNKTVKGKKK